MWDLIKPTRKIIGRGGMGEVKIAYYTKIPNKKFALKTIDTKIVTDSELRRFLREIKIISNVSHPNIINIYEWSDDPKRPGYLMEYCEKGNLSTYYENKSIAQKMKLFWGVLDGIEYLHNHNDRIIHRDIKPENILINSDGIAKISDFGISYLGKDNESRLTGTVTTLVSLKFSSPEQFRDFHSTDEKSDIYSLGAVLYYMLVNGHHFSKTEDLNKFELPVTDFLKKMLNYDPRLRFQNTKELKKFWNENIVNSDDPKLEKYIYKEEKIVEREKYDENNQEDLELFNIFHNPQRYSRHDVE